MRSLEGNERTWRPRPGRRLIAISNQFFSSALHEPLSNRDERLFAELVPVDRFHVRKSLHREKFGGLGLDLSRSKTPYLRFSTEVVRVCAQELSTITSRLESLHFSFMYLSEEFCAIAARLTISANISAGCTHAAFMSTKS
jgi:hypothetical protein